MSGIIKASFLRLMLRPTALCLDVCNRHIIYLGRGRGELLCGISNPSRRSKFPKVNQVSLRIQHKNCSFPNRSTRAAHAGKHPQTWLQKTARSDIPQAVFWGETESKLITQDVLWWSKNKSTRRQFFTLFSVAPKTDDPPSPGPGPDMSCVFLHSSSFISHQTTSACTGIDLPRGCWKEVILQRDLQPVWPRGIQALCSVQVYEPFLSPPFLPITHTHTHTPFYRALNKRLAGFSSSSVEDFHQRSVNVINNEEELRFSTVFILILSFSVLEQSHPSGQSHYWKQSFPE